MPNNECHLHNLALLATNHHQKDPCKISVLLIKDFLRKSEKEQKEQKQTTYA